MSTPNLRRHAGYLVGDYPNAIRMRAASLRDWPVPEAFGRGSRRPVVILPGVYETWHYLRPLADALNRAGHPVHVLPALGLNTAPIPVTVERVDAELAARGLTDAALVAHSKGGIVGKQLLARHPAERLPHLVAIASPFAGSSMARLVRPVRALRDFLPTAPVITALAGELAVNSRITSIYPRFDPHIPEGSHLEGATNIELDVVGHFRILLQPELYLRVVEAVAD